MEIDLSSPKRHSKSSRKQVFSNEEYELRKILKLGLLTNKTLPPIHPYMVDAQNTKDGEQAS
jgi:hypothetical protein